MGRGFTPSVRDLEGLLVLAADSDRDVGKSAVRALVRLGPPALASAQAMFATATPPLRARLVDVIAKVDAQVSWLQSLLTDHDGATRRRAASHLGKLVDLSPEQARETEAALTRVMTHSRDAADRRAFAEALGRLASASALGTLADALGTEGLDGKRLATARVRIKQRAARQLPSRVDLRAEVPEPTPVLLHVRAGLEPLLLEELAGVSALVESAREVGRGRVRVVWQGPMAPLFSARTFLHLGFPVPTPSGMLAVDAVVHALTSPATQRLLRALTQGPVRYRLAWAARGHRKPHTEAVAARVEAAVPWLINDATQAPWEVVVSESEGKSGRRTFVELWPKRLDDPRFNYRKQTMPASSHPTIAAALVRVAGVKPADVVWDPFAGTGMELIERGLAGRYGELWGTDVDPQAVAAARENLQAAGVEAQIIEQDARTFSPPTKLDLVLTNPPFGQRVPVQGGVETLLEEVLGHAVTLLAPRGRVVLITPRVHTTARVLSQAGLVRQRQLPVDVGGFSAHLELWQRLP